MKYSVFDSILLSEKIWLPKNVTWNEILSHPTIHYPNVVDLFGTLIWSIPLMFAIRYLVIKFVFNPLGHRFNLKATKSRRAPFHRFLEETYLKMGNRALKTPQAMKQMTTRTGLDKKQIHVWFKFRWAQDEITDLDKFTEDCWLAIVHASMTICGYNVTAQNSCLYNIDSCWENFPYQNATRLQEFFYKMGMTSLVVDSVILLVKRHETKDIQMRLFHHTVTFLVMLFSWLTNALRVGCVTLFLLESTSPLVFIGKAAEWLKITNLSKTAFTIVILQWFLVRGVWYTFFLPRLLYRRHEVLSFNPVFGLYVCEFFLLLILLVNVHYARLIVKKLGSLAKGNCFTLNLSDEAWSQIVKTLESNENIFDENESVKGTAISN